MAADEILDDTIALWKSLDGRPVYGPHAVTGPIDVEGAEPGDTLMIEILDIETRTPWGMNYTGSDTGVFSPSFPGHRAGDSSLGIPVTAAEAFSMSVPSPGVGTHLLRTGVHEGREVAFFNDGTHVPLHKFFGVMAVKPLESGEVQSSVPPGAFGGNLDTRDYTVGATLYLPVFHAGAGFYLGDGHSVQGDGEVAGTAIEHSLTGTFRLTVLRGRRSEQPSGEDAVNFLVHGIDEDIHRALKLAVGNTIAFLERTKDLTTAEAYSLTSIAVGYSISEAVNGTVVVTGRIPKALWAETGRAERTALAARARTRCSTLTVPEAAQELSGA
ncbi:acetamidase/formamidase family protein [Cryptosporangium phraense]|uniref:acetamidase/formamidase family protein n=1 Tax=Cryptosporangium phraense TaxID=2593070 RepID=UPI00197A83B0|nr:acetamidase/formamidase family protein [Cryptosporangium phraense]